MRSLSTCWTVGLFALLLTGCANVSAPLPAYVFSLTAWTAGRDVELLLLNVTDNPVRASRNIVGTLSVEVRDEADQSVTNGFVRYDETAPVPTVGRTRKLKSQQVFRETLSSEALVRRVEQATGAPLDRTRSYRLGFETATPVVADNGALAFAKVRSRSNCSLSFDGGRARVSCGSG